jgi:hypothetical protein
MFPNNQLKQQENLTEKDHLVHVGVNGKVIMKFIFNKEKWSGGLEIAD